MTIPGGDALGQQLNLMAQLMCGRPRRLMRAMAGFRVLVVADEGGTGSGAGAVALDGDLGGLLGDAHEHGAGEGLAGGGDGLAIDSEDGAERTGVGAVAGLTVGTLGGDGAPAEGVPARQRDGVEVLVLGEGPIELLDAEDADDVGDGGLGDELAVVALVVDLAVHVLSTGGDGGHDLLLGDVGAGDGRLRSRRMVMIWERVSGGASSAIRRPAIVIRSSSQSRVQTWLS